MTGIPWKSAQYFSERPFKMPVRKYVLFFSVPESEIIAVRKSLYVLAIWYQKDCKTICLFGLFWGYLLWKGGWAEKKSLQFTKCWVKVSPHSALWHWCVRQGGEAPWSKPCCSCLLTCPTSCPHTVLPWGNGWCQGRVKSRQKYCAKILQKSVKRWADITAISTLFSKTYWWQAFKSRRQVTAF